MRGKVALFAFVAFATGCTTSPGRVGLPPAPRTGSALAWVSLRPLPENLPPSGLGLSRLAFVRETGEEVPVTLDRTRVEPRTGTVILGRAGLAPGRYREIVVEVAQAAGVAAARLSAPITLPLAAGQGAAVAVQLAWPEGGGPGADTLRLRAEVIARPPVAMSALALCRDDDALAVLDKRTGEVASVAPLGRRPEGLVLDAVRRRAYVAVTGDDALQSVDLEQATVLTRQVLRIGDEPIDLAVTPDGRTLLVALRGAGAVAFVDTASLSEVTRIAVGSGPRSVLLDRAGRRAYVLNTRSSNLSVIDVGNRAVVATVPLESGPVRGAFSRTGDRLFVLYESAPFLSVVDLVPDLRVSQRVDVNVLADAILLDPQSERLYLARRDGGGIDVYDPLSVVPIDTFPLPGRVRFMAVDGETNGLLAALAEPPGVAARNLLSRAPAWNTELPGEVVYVTVAGKR